MKGVINTEEVIISYENGESMHSIAKRFGTYTITIKRILEKNNIKLRHDEKKNGQLYVKDGEKLIEWAKKQKRLVTRDELALLIGKKRLSPSYFIKYPELGKYVETRKQKGLKEYHSKLYDLLNRNNILYKPNDKTKLNVIVDALLLGEYSGIAIHLLEKPKDMSKKRHTEQIREKIQRAKKAGIILVLIEKEQINDTLIDTLNSYKPIKQTR